jgi:hypothetical protein
VVVAGLSLYVLLPSLLSVFGVWRSLGHVDWLFAVLVVLCVVASFVCLWELERVALGTRAWFPVVTAELSGNALSHVVPSPAPGGVLEASMLSTRMRSPHCTTTVRRRSLLGSGEAAATTGG